MAVPKKYPRRYDAYTPQPNWFSAENGSAKRYPRKYGYRYGAGPVVTPIITITAHTRDRIGLAAGYDLCLAWFTPSVRLSRWEARANGGSGHGHGIGLLVGSGGFVDAGQAVEFEIDDTELTGGDKTYQITVYGQALLGGIWSG